VTDNFAILLVTDEGVEVVPPGRSVRAGVEELRLGVEWDPASSAWSEVVVDRFIRVGDGSAVAVEAPVRFVRGGPTAGGVRFLSIERSSDFCEYDVTVRGEGLEPHVRTFHVLLLGVRDDTPANQGREP
jgi:hypothetical protein